MTSIGTASSGKCETSTRENRISLVDFLASFASSFPVFGGVGIRGSMFYGGIVVCLRPGGLELELEV